MHQQFNTEQLYALPTLDLCALYWGFVVVAVLLSFFGVEFVLLLNVFVICYYLLFCCSVCVSVFAVVG